MAGEANMRTSTAMMRSKAEDTERLATELENSFHTMYNHVIKLEEYWIGDAANTYNDMFRRQIQISDSHIAKLRAHIEALREAAGVFDQVERENQAMVEEIKANVID